MRRLSRLNLPSRVLQNANLLGCDLETRVSLAQQIEAQEALLDLAVVPFEPLTPGIGGNVVEKKEKLANAICPSR